MTNFSTPMRVHHSHSQPFILAYLRLLLNSLANYESDGLKWSCPRTIFLLNEYIHTYSVERQPTNNQNVWGQVWVVPHLDWKVKNCSHVTFIVYDELSILVDLSMFLLATREWARYEEKLIALNGCLFWHQVNHIKL